MKSLAPSVVFSLILKHLIYIAKSSHNLAFFYFINNIKVYRP